MLSNKLALTFLGLVGFVGAVGSGAYLASHRAADAPPAAVTAPGPAEPSGMPVESTEAVMDDGAQPGTPALNERAASPKAAPSAAVTARRTPSAARTPARETPRPAPAPSRTPAAAPQSPRPDASTDTVTADRGAPRDGNSARRSWPTTDEPENAPGPETPVAREDRRPVDPLPPAPQFEDITVPADAVIGLQIENTVSSETARVEDRVEARVTRDVRSNGRVAIPAGSKMLGSVNVVERGGKMKERARLGVRFHTVILADGTEVPLQTDTIYREGESPANASAAKVGGAAVGGAILGAILGGGKGAAIGGAIGAGAGTGAVMAGSRRAATIQAGSPVTVKVLSPVTVNVEK